MQQKKVLNNFKSRLFPIKNLDKIPTRELAPEQATQPTKHKKSKLKSQHKVMNEIIADEKGINDEMFYDYVNNRTHRF